MAFNLSDKQWKWIAIGWFVLTTLLLVVPGNALPKTDLGNIPYFDKYIHIFLFAVLSAFTLKAIRPTRPTYFIWLVVLVILYGTLMEYVQLYLVPFRSFDGRDIMADAAGAVLGLLLYRLLNRVFRPAA
ncbi:MAG TPA: VanZ family protein [Phnomibacter sp.]|nr:VanZ family protein [Phnomibacter sp.]